MKTSKMKRRIRTVKTLCFAFAGVFAALVVVAIVGWSMFGEQILAARTVEQIDEGLYTMAYDGEYGFGEFLEQGGAATDGELAAYLADYISHGFYQPNPKEQTYGCSTLAVTSADGQTLFGRNFDWTTCRVMIVKTVPKEGYASISTCNLDFLGFDESWSPTGSFMDQMMTLAAVYVPLDGMNEKGLCVADLVIEDGTETHQDNGKTDLTTTAAIRLLLDRAANVDEALALLQNYDMHSSSGMQHHLALADASGRRVVVEYINNVMYCTETPAVTNFYLTPGDHYGKGDASSKNRYDRLMFQYALKEGRMTGQTLMDTLLSVEQNKPEEYRATQWNVIYDTRSLTAFYRVHGKDVGEISIVK